MKEVFRVKCERGKRLLRAWLQGLRRCRVPPFARLARSITEHSAGIEATLDFGLSNAWMSL